MAEGGGLEPPSPKAPVFKTGALPVTLTLRGMADKERLPSPPGYCTAEMGGMSCDNAQRAALRGALRGLRVLRGKHFGIGCGRWLPCVHPPSLCFVGEFGLL